MDWTKRAKPVAGTAVPVQTPGTSMDWTQLAPQQQPTGSLYGMDPQDPTAAIIEQLMSQLQMAQPPKPQPVGAGQQIVGALGDALMNLGNMRAGGQAQQGPFAQSMQQRQLIQQQQQMEAEQYNREIRNQTRIALSEGNIRGIREKEIQRLRQIDAMDLERMRQEGDVEIEKLRQQGRSEMGYRQNLEFRSAEAAPEDVQEARARGIPLKVGDPVVIGFNNAGEPVVVRRGQEILRTIQTPGGGVGLLGSKTGDFNVAVDGQGNFVTREAPAEARRDFAQREVAIASLDSVVAAHSKIRGFIAQKDIGEGEQVFKSLVGETRFGGVPFFNTAEFKDFDAARKAGLNNYVKAQTGAQFSFRELQRYAGQWPEAWEPDNVARSKVSALANLMVSDMQAMVRQNPGLVSDGLPPPDRNIFSLVGVPIPTQNDVDANRLTGEVRARSQFEEFYGQYGQDAVEDAVREFRDSGGIVIEE